MKEAIEHTLVRSDGPTVSVHVHITGPDERAAPLNADWDDKRPTPATTFVEGRPALPVVIRETCTEASGRVAVAGMVIDVIGRMRLMSSSFSVWT
jgi:hypothetical protein